VWNIFPKEDPELRYARATLDLMAMEKKPDSEVLALVREAMDLDAAVLERVKPWLLAMGTAVTHVGPLGLAKTMKVATNLGLAVQIFADNIRELRRP
jgi:hypothetical protein